MQSKTNMQSKIPNGLGDAVPSRPTVAGPTIQIKVDRLLVERAMEAEEGRYTTAAEVVCHGLALIIERTAKDAEAWRQFQAAVKKAPAQSTADPDTREWVGEGHDDSEARAAGGLR